MKFYELYQLPSHGEEPWEVSPSHILRLTPEEAESLFRGINGGAWRLRQVQVQDSSSDIYLDLAYSPEPPRE